MGVGSNRRVVFVLRENHPLALLPGGREGSDTVAESEFDNAVASLWVTEVFRDMMS